MSFPLLSGLRSNDLAIDLGVGPAAATVTTTDLPPEALRRHGELD